MKNFWRNIHLYLGLAAGIVIMITCFTGATLVFEKEWQQLIYPERYTVTPGEKRISLDETAIAFQKNHKGASVTGIKIYSDPTRSLELSYSEEKKHEGKKDGKKADGDKEKSHKEHGKKEEGKKPEAGKGAGGGSQAFVNPYTGELISLYTYRNTFFFTMFSLHRWLLAGDIGKLIVGISTSIFLFIIITGIILWWPKTKAKLKQHLTVKWAGWKRINHDLHIVIGFYTCIFLFAFAFTGLAWSFEWFNNGIYWITGTENKRPEPPASIAVAGTTITFDQVYTAIKQQAPEAAYYTLNKPKDSTAAYAVTVMPLNPVHEKASDQYFFDQYTGQLLGTALYKDRNLGQRVRGIFYPIHVGSIGGVPGRIIAFLSCIAGVTFPVTGVILWINRLNKKKKKAKKKESRSAKPAAQKEALAV
ncbi:MAG TPA: PepSY-associated TM helix domain-containing protein [Ohtaekwangia sp.]|uniref:PepSY-associated TM helix domain-containing protein n=1 Tax=Ohtaekwangia sp. TaxID=2066019 RepID=UPI002F95C401